jgi:hypothetical protein
MIAPPVASVSTVSTIEHERAPNRLRGRSGRIELVALFAVPAFLSLGVNLLRPGSRLVLTLASLVVGNVAAIAPRGHRRRSCHSGERPPLPPLISPDERDP